MAFSLVQDFPTSIGLGKTLEVGSARLLNPLEASDFLTFDSTLAALSGTIPTNISYQHISVTFTAYSHITHSTSHATLLVSLSPSDFENQHNKCHGSLSPAAREKLILGVKMAFGIIRGFVAFSIFFAVLPPCYQVPDTAVVGEVAGPPWKESDREKWYGGSHRGSRRGSVGPLLPIAPMAGAMASSLLPATMMDSGLPRTEADALERFS